jgi:radical SAM protein with 4Fe4S-binding SPASM domain
MCPQVAYREKELGGRQITASPYDGAKQELTKEEILRAVRRLADAGTRLILFTGGEPFLRKDMVEILRETKAMGLAVHVINNGSMITDEIARALVEMGVDGMTFSLDGPEEEHDMIRKLPRAFKRLTAAIERIQAEKNRQGKSEPKLALSAVIHAKNQHVLADIVDVAHTHGIGFVNYNYLFFTTPELEFATRQILDRKRHLRAVKPEDQNLPPELRDIQVEALMREVEEVRRRGRELGITTNFEPELEGDEIRKRFEDPNHTVVHRCFYPWKVMRIDAWGNAYPCSIDTHLGNVRTDDILAVWNGEAYKNFRRKLKEHGLFPQCTKCCILSERQWNHLPDATIKAPKFALPVLRQSHRLGG